MKRATIRRWLPVGIYGVAALCLLIFGFIPHNRKARQGSSRAETLRTELLFFHRHLHNNPVIIVHLPY